MFRKILIACSALLLSTVSTYAAVAETFDVTVSKTAAVGEALDITVRVVDGEGNTVPSYTDTIFFAVDGNDEATIPFADDGYTFLPEDAGVKTFSKGLVFTKTGTHSLVVLDLGDLQTSIPIIVTDGDEVNVDDEIITLSSPEHNSTVAESNIFVSGTTKPNSLVIIYLNDEDIGETQSDSEGAFSLEATNVAEGANIFLAEVLDSEENVVGISDEVVVTVVNSGPQIDSLETSADQVFIGQDVTFTLFADPGLQESLLTLDNNTVELVEADTGKYMATLATPLIPGSYSASLSLKNTLGVSANVTDAKTISTVLPNIMDVNGATVDNTATVKFKLEYMPSSLSQFSATYTASNEANNGVVVFPKADLTPTEDGVYSINLELPEDTYSITLSGADANNAIVTNPSEVLSLETKDPIIEEPVAEEEPIIEEDPFVCADVEGIHLSKEDLKSTVTWNKIDEAVSYNIYKKDAEGDFVLVDNVTTTEYVIYAEGDDVIYADYAVKAVCDPENNLESQNLSEMVKVQTGPVEFFIIFVIAGILGLVVTRRLKING